jgi:hypothetical protein
MTRFVPVTVLLLLATSRVASADTGMLPDGSRVSFDRLFIRENGDDFKEPKVTPDSLWNYFNLAHCQCSQSPPQGFVETSFQFVLTLQGQVTPNQQPLEIWVGSQCDVADLVTRNAMCHAIKNATIGMIADIAASNGATITIPLVDHGVGHRRRRRQRYPRLLRLEYRAETDQVGYPAARAPDRVPRRGW